MIKRLLVLTLLFCGACSRGNDAHYAEVEKHRQEQAAQPAASATATPSPSPTASASPSPGQAAPTAPSRNYWTNFRGPRRDGKYDEAGVSTSWPASGLPAVWKQPIGVGHASFAVADGKAYTIEQRRNQEVVAAYDIDERSRALDAKVERGIHRLDRRWTTRDANLGPGPHLRARRNRRIAMSRRQQRLSDLGQEYSD